MTVARGYDVRVAPRFCDAQGMVHASRYQEFLEDAFLDWLAQNGFPYAALRGRGIDLVIGAVEIRYRAPTHLDDILHVETQATSSSRSTLVMAFHLGRRDVTVAEATVSYIAVQDGHAAPLPDELAVDYTELSVATLLERLHAAQRAFYSGGSRAALEDVLDPDVVWHVPGRNAIAGTYAGRDAVLDYMARRRDLADRSFRMHPGEVLVGPTWFAALVGGSATIDGQDHSWQTIGVYRRSGNRIIECFLVPFDQDEFDRIWSNRTA